MSKVTSRQAFMGVAVVGLVALLLVYVLVYMKYTQMAAELDHSNDMLRQEVNNLKGYYDNIPVYNQQREEMKQAAKDILAEYPADAREEDAIMLAVQLQSNVDVAVPSINIGAGNLLYEIPAETVTAAGIEEYQTSVDFFDLQATYSNSTTYENLKECIEQIYKADNRIAINSLAYSKNDAEGKLEGSLNISFYSAAGTGKEYQAPDITPYLKGLSNIFQ